jgi:predicted porin
VWFQCTSSFDVIGVAASNTTGAGQWCGRNSAIGFRGGFGNVFFGTWDTPHKLVSNLARGWWGGTNTLQGGSLTLLANGSDSNVPNRGDTFFRRHQRSINYHSPDFGGFSFQAATSSGNEATAFTTGSPLKPRLMSLAGQFRTGPFFAGVGYEKHDDFNPGGVATAAYLGGSDESINVAVGFTFFGNLRVAGLYMQNEFEAGDGFGSTVETTGYAVYVDWTIAGPHSLKFQWATVGDDEGNPPVASSGAQVYGAAYSYAMSKRTSVYVAYNEMKNDSNANYSFGTTATTLGGNQKVIGLGLRHSF